MQNLPHHYRTTATAEPEGEVQVCAPGLPVLHTAPPAEFGGPGNLWSPETLLCAAVADCFILSFRAIAKARSLAWGKIDCAVEGVLERADGKTRFTAFTLQANLTLPADSDQALADKCLHRAEETCLVSNSLSAPVALELTIS